MSANFIWDDINERKVWAHSIEIHEVEEIFLDPRGHRSRTKSKQYRRYRLIGKTSGGRFLKVIFEILPEGIRVVTAYDTKKSERRLYSGR